MGRRIVTASEVNEGTRLNEARLKALTGGDLVTARFLHAEFFDYQPVLKLWLAVNHKPVVRDDSHGLWRRVRLIPFKRPFTRDADPAFRDLLRAELPGILAWAVQGCDRLASRMGSSRRRLSRQPPTSYRAESDPIGEFLAERCVVGDGYEAQASSPYSAYRGWAADSSLRDREVISSRTFGDHATARFAKVKRNNGSFYLGVGLLAGYPGGASPVTDQ